MQKYDRVLDYVIEQANRNDARCLQFEQDIVFLMSKRRDFIFSRIVSRGVGCETLVEMQTLLNSIEALMQVYLSDSKNILRDKFSKYRNIGYENTDQLINVGLDVEKRFSRNIKEMAIERDDETIKYVRNHAFDMLTGYSADVIQKIRAMLGDLILKKNANRANVQKAIEKALGVSPSKAQEIAQTELSRAYNFGVIARLKQYENESGTRVRKYWHGFQYSPKTCSYCVERIGNVYDLDENIEQLPAHPRCRCVWLPVLEGWDGPVDKSIISRANMLATGYSEEQIYNRINSRLGINYGKYLKVEDAVEYLEGNRTPDIMSKISNARDKAIDVVKDSLQIQQDTNTDTWSKRFNVQMGFWKSVVSEAIVDNDKEQLGKCYDGLKAVMVLPWSSEQMAKWDKLLRSVDEARS